MARTTGASSPASSPNRVSGPSVMTPKRKSSVMKAKKERKSRSKRAGLTFPVSRIHRNLRESTTVQRISAGASVYLSAVLEYMASEIADIGGDAAKQHKKSRIIPRHLQLAIRGDDEFDVFFKDITIAQGGVLPKPTN